ncbi:hypothetical protein Droror1_Dr00005148 [Drosera rotundifolia]
MFYVASEGILSHAWLVGLKALNTVYQLLLYGIRWINSAVCRLPQNPETTIVSVIMHKSSTDRTPRAKQSSNSIIHSFIRSNMIIVNMKYIIIIMGKGQVESISSKSSQPATDFFILVDKITILSRSIDVYVVDIPWNNPKLKGIGC